MVIFFDCLPKKLSLLLLFLHKTNLILPVFTVTNAINYNLIHISSILFYYLRIPKIVKFLFTFI